MPRVLAEETWANIQALPTDSSYSQYKFWCKDVPVALGPMRAFVELINGVWTPTSPRPRRQEVYSISVPATPVTIPATAPSTAIISFSSAFNQVDAIMPVPMFVGEQLIEPYVVSNTLQQCVVQSRRSKGTLLLSSGPFEAPNAAVTVTVVVIGT